MDFTYLGRSGLQVSRLCLGTMNVGRYGSEPGETEIIIARVRQCSLWAASADKS